MTNHPPVRGIRAVLCLVAALALSGCGGPTDEAAVRTNRVDLPKSYRFEPAVIEVDVDTTVTWRNHDDFPHNVHLLDGTDRKIDLPIGASGSIAFEKPGRVEYECSLHPQQMRGTVVVE